MRIIIDIFRVDTIVYVAFPWRDFFEKGTCTNLNHIRAELYNLICRFMGHKRALSIGKRPCAENGINPWIKTEALLFYRGSTMGVQTDRQTDRHKHMHARTPTRTDLFVLLRRQSWMQAGSPRQQMISQLFASMIYTFNACRKMKIVFLRRGET